MYISHFADLGIQTYISAGSMIGMESTKSPSSHFLLLTRAFELLLHFHANGLDRNVLQEVRNYSLTISKPIPNLIATHGPKHLFVQFALMAEEVARFGNDSAMVDQLSSLLEYPSVETADQILLVWSRTAEEPTVAFYLDNP